MRAGSRAEPSPAPSPLETLLDSTDGEALPLPAPLDDLYGPLRFPRAEGRPHVVANFASTIDGVTSLGPGDPSGGGQVTGRDPHDRLVLGLLRAVADAVIVGAGTLRASPRHRWTAARAVPGLAREFEALRSALGRTGPPLTVVVSATGSLDLGLPVFSSGEAPVLIVTSSDGGRRLRSMPRPAGVEVAVVATDDRVPAAEVLGRLAAHRATDRVVVEGGPHLMGDFLAERCLDELFLTLAPQVAGRVAPGDRLGLVAGRTLAPDHRTWGRLRSVKRGGSHLFLRYAFEPREKDRGT